MTDTGGLILVHVDPLFVVVDKPGGLLAVPGRGPDMQDCVVSRLRALFPDCIGQPAVHRLDMDTSGLMLLARSRQAHRDLSLQFQQRRVGKRYVAILEGQVSGSAGTIRLSFRLDPDNRPRQVLDPVHGKPGVTRWRLLDRQNGRSRIEFVPLTGRTHQLRLHAAHPAGLGCPIVGDRLYGNGTRSGEMLLHATELAFVHPVTRQRLVFCSRPPF
ncbi:MAG TPA: RluA family pseudouridine synthase [Desulfobulbus sp.]|nr:RluA family pseudouridine synthase [Desulfobulbus sp.]